MNPRVRRASPSSGTTRAFFALTLLVYVGVYPYLAALNNPNENVRTYMTMALVEGHTLAIDAIVARHGWVNDMAKIAAPPAPGQAHGQVPEAPSFHLYSVKGPAVSYAGVPVYWAFRAAASVFGRSVPAVDGPEAERARWLRDATFVLRLFVVQLPCFAFLVAFERWLRRVTSDESLRLSAVAAFGLGTNYLAYSHMFASHALTAATAFVAFALATDALHAPREPSRTNDARAFAAGLGAGLTTLLDYHALPVSFVLALYAAYAFRAPRAVAFLALGGLLPALVLLDFQRRAFGSAFATGHRASENESYAALLNQGFLGLGVPSPRAAALLAFDRSFGLFGTAPFLALGLFVVPFGLIAPPAPTDGAAPSRAASRLPTVAWLTAMALLWVTVSAAVNWRGGWTIGPRYLGAAPPFFAFGAVTALEELARRRAFANARELSRALATGLVLAGVLQTGVVSLFVSSLPEEITRPLGQLVAPFLAEGRAPYHLGDLVGLTGTAPWLAVAAALVAATLLAATAGVPRGQRAARLVVTLLVAAPLVVTAAAGTFGKGSPKPEARAKVAAQIAEIRAAWEPSRP